MGLLKVMDDAPGFLKATFQGPQGSGKTYTATKLACLVHKLFGSKKPIAFFDTETGSDYVKDLIVQSTGMQPLRHKGRAFSDLMAVAKECSDGAADILLMDSITHVWRELNRAYFVKMNEGRRYQKTRLDVNDIGQIKELWAPWPDLFLTSPIHMVVCGREGNEWGNEEDEETGKRTLIQVGKKMKVEAEFGYEASLQIAMGLIQVPETIIKRKNKTQDRAARQFVNRATVLKDRFDVINSHVFDMPTGEEFLPHLKLLHPELHVAVDTQTRSHEGMPDMEDNGWFREKQDRTILTEEIQGEMVKHYPGQTAKEKALKSQLLEEAFATRSWSKVEGTNSRDLRAGLDRMRAILNDKPGLEKRTTVGVKEAA